MSKTMNKPCYPCPDKRKLSKEEELNLSIESCYLLHMSLLKKAEYLITKERRRR